MGRGGVWWEEGGSGIRTVCRVMWGHCAKPLQAPNTSLVETAAGSSLEVSSFPNAQLKSERPSYRPPPARSRHLRCSEPFCIACLARPTTHGFLIARGLASRIGKSFPCHHRQGKSISRRLHSSRGQHYLGRHFRTEYAAEVPRIFQRGFHAMPTNVFAPTDRSFVNLPVLGIPASLALAYVLAGPEPLPSLLMLLQLRSGLHVLCSRSLRLSPTNKGLRSFTRVEPSESCIIEHKSKS